MSKSKYAEKIIESLRDRVPRKVRKTVRSVLGKQPGYANEKAKHLIESVTDAMDDWRDIGAWGLFNIYFAKRPDPNLSDPLFQEVVESLCGMLKEDSDDIRGVALIALGNLGPHAVRCAMALHKNCIIRLAGSKNSYAKKASAFAMDQLTDPIVQPDGKPKLNASQVKQIRSEWGMDVPAYQESANYHVDSNEGEGKKTKLELPE
jgi:hypothetical protein